ncbi:thymidine kinase [Kosakonia phage Kc263]|uniref:Thymidine kinase n=1 Tax=Kosakonia phage Kc263 TaxID=2863194 RepID=A0AAE8BGL5_9CAUD|nr:thymidine kinase [Kosakonia phage Kc263]QYN80137.1 thymidine kinase [Kosakonia phage Kc263]
MASLHFYYSTMNAGKSAALIQSNYNYKERGMRTLVLKPAIDTREGRSVIRSRTGSEVECVTFGPGEDLYTYVVKHRDPVKPSAVFIDEAQFMTAEQVKQLAMVVDYLEIPVIAYGLRTDFQGKLFPGSAALFELANKLIQLKTICWCGCAATMVLRVDDDGYVVREGNQVQVGGNDTYVSVCRNHFMLGKTSRF